MESLTTFPIQADDEGERIPALWTLLSHTIEPENHAPQTLEKDVSKCVHQAYASLLRAYTGEEAISFVTGTSMPDGVQDIAVYSYELSKVEGSESQSSRCLKEKHRSDISMLASGGNILLRTNPGNGDNQLNRKTIEPMRLERTPLRIAYSADPSIGCIDMVAWFDRRCLTPFHAERYFQHLVSNISSAWQAEGLDQSRVAEQITLRDKEFIQTWNGKPQELVDRCLHDCIAERVTEDGIKVAIDAWDGRMSRAELEEAATNLAIILLQAAVKPRGVVGILLEKSMWEVVAMLAVNKAGAGFILLDPSLPAERLKIMTRQLSTTHLITKKDHMTVACTLASTVITHSGGGDFRITDTGNTCEKHITSNRLPSVSSSDPTFYIFTSGSSGVPKAIIIPHDAWVTTCGEGYQYGIDESSRLAEQWSFQARRNA
ncbi:hypothetical protein CBER1_11224 [Cercospora berteroae]|uniref:AMP-dependent synthetase/ligase domain-containing protein n=1 Tax=Cercospora berteroae TaxID=357750 RepID=A0A2S6BZR4_9PEZI|nr:hypothetical protein CBER1_11224 [Cercospora berteroae]